jgi:protein-tyrosine phosphatase
MIADEGIPSLRELMELVQDESNWPILIHCSAGKDRAGVATALILEAVGVDRDTIMEDYLLSNEVSRAQEKAELLSKDKRKYRSGSKLGRGPTPGAWFQIIGVAPEMLASFYAHVEERYGSMDAFLTELGVEPEERKTLAASLTEPAGLAQDTP